jgi:hypothetical protein
MLALDSQGWIPGNHPSILISHSVCLLLGAGLRLVSVGKEPARKERLFPQRTKQNGDSDADEDGSQKEKFRQRNADQPHRQKADRHDDGGKLSAQSRNFERARVTWCAVVLHCLYYDAVAFARARDSKETYFILIFRSAGSHSARG